MERLSKPNLGPARSVGFDSLDKGSTPPCPLPPLLKFEFGLIALQRRGGGKVYHIDIEIWRYVTRRAACSLADRLYTGLILSAAGSLVLESL